MPGGYIPDPEVPKKIESLDWPSPPYPAAVPELRSRSRSTSNKRASSLNKQDLNQTEHLDSIKKCETIIENRNLNDVISATKVYRKIYDNQHDDYLQRFKRNKNDEEDDEQIVVNEKIKRDIEEISKLEDKCGIAKIIAQELKVIH